MRFTVLERFFLFNLLETKEASIDTMLTVRKLRRALAFRESEVTEINFRDDLATGGVRWDCEIASPPEIKVTDRARVIIKERLEAYKQAGRPIVSDLVNLVAEFLGDEDEEPAEDAADTDVPAEADTDTTNTP